MNLGVATPFALLLVVAGIDKLRAASGAREALSLVGMSPHPVFVVALPIVEMMIGLAFLVMPGPIPALALALAYGMFAVVVVRELRSGRGSSCGCFGDRSGKLTASHLVVDVLGVAAAVGAAIVALGSSSGAPLLDIVHAGWGPSVAAIVASLTAAMLLRAVLVDLVPLAALIRSSEVSS